MANSTRKNNLSEKMDYILGKLKYTLGRLTDPEKKKYQVKLTKIAGK